jgi:hypothetical protein
MQSQTGGEMMMRKGIEWVMGYGLWVMGYGNKFRTPYALRLTLYALRLGQSRFKLVDPACFLYFSPTNLRI